LETSFRFQINKSILLLWITISGTQSSPRRHVEYFQLQKLFSELDF